MLCEASVVMQSFYSFWLLRNIARCNWVFICSPTEHLRECFNTVGLNAGFDLRAVTHNCNRAVTLLDKACNNEMLSIYMYTVQTRPTHLLYSLYVSGS